MNLEKFIEEKGGPKPIVSQERIELFARILKSHVQGAIQRTARRGYTDEVKRIDRSRQARFRALQKAVENLNDTDLRFLDIALALTDESDEIQIHDSFTARADALLSPLNEALHQCRDFQVCNRFEARQRRSFVEHAARLFIALGFDTIGTNPEDIFGQFTDLVLMQAGGHMKPPFLNSLESPICDAFGQTEAERKKRVEEIQAELSQPE